MLRQVKNIILFLFTNFYITAYNQVIRGTVFDAEIKSSIPFATMYFNGTFVGITSDQDGIFKKDGYFDPSGIQWEGQMAEKRIADWLPYEYSIEE